MYVYIYIFTGERETWGREEEGESVSRLHARGEENPSERRRVVRERDRVGARRLAVAVRAAGRALVDGPEHDATDPSVEVGDDGLLVLDAAADARVGLRPRLEADDGLGRRDVLSERVDDVEPLCSRRLATETHHSTSMTSPAL